VPSVLHEAIIDLLRRRRSLVVELVERERPLPRHDEVRLDESSFVSLAPAEFLADMVLVLHSGGPVLRLVVEVQLRVDHEKWRAWPMYLATAFARGGCPVALVVVTPFERVARWAAAPIVIGPGSELRPIVLGPAQIPASLSVEEAIALPELAVLSVLAHGRRFDGVEPALAALRGADRLDASGAGVYFDLVMSSLRRGLADEVRAMFAKGTYKYRSQWAKDLLAEGRVEGRTEGLAQGRAEGRDQGLVEGRDQGLVEGRDQGLVEGRDQGLIAGRVEGLADSLLAVLRVRKIAVRAADARRIRGCRDAEQLHRWLARAVEVAKAKDIFTDD